MGLFDKFTDAAMDRLTEADLDEMEAAGQDVSKYRTRLAEKKESIQKMGETDLAKLDKYVSTPRDRNSDFFKDVAGKAPLFGKGKFYSKNENAELIYTVVVQAAPGMYQPGNIDTTAMIVLTPTNDKFKKDFDELRKLADLLVAMRDEEVEVPKALKKLVKDLNNPSSHIDVTIKGEDIDSEYYAGAEFSMNTIYLSQNDLPNNMIPNDRIVPCLHVKEGNSSYVVMIKGKWYQK